jgi:hypothetical protein
VARKPERRQGPSEAVLLATIANKHAWIVTWRIVLTLLSLAALTLATAPVAHQIAGTNTNFNVNIAITFAVTLVFTQTVTGVYAENRRRRAKHLEQRNRVLETWVEDLQAGAGG